MTTWPTPRRSVQAMLLGGTALVLLASPGQAAPAPNAQPTGGKVSAGTATISQTATVTTIAQTSQRAAVDWTGFDVGSNQAVNFQQPSAASVTLNRVTSANPSQIAGSISANGQVVLVNQSGVVFSKGSQVNAQSLVVSGAGISNQNFMAGQMVFDQPGNPNARVVNNGTITVKQAGLAALVAPQVVNNGVINAKMGHVILAGAQTHTVDLYGDGMLSLDITSQVQQAPVGRGGKPVSSLVTNNGTIRADGGTILLTASAADGVVQNLVTANGRAYADTIGQQTGTVVVRGTGGSILVLGKLRAAGRTDGTVGGQVELNATGAVTVAASARVNASGRAGGGTVAIGTTLARANAGPSFGQAATASSVSVAPGAKITASGTRTGKGGQVTILSTGQTTQAGAITAKGGPQGGDGGTVEVSGGTVALTGTIDVSAPKGALGTILLDPLDLVISDTPTGGTQITGPNGTSAGATANGSSPNVTESGQPDANTVSYITPATIQGLTGNIQLEATRDLTVASSVALAPTAGQSLTLLAGRNLTVNSGVTVSAPGGLELIASAQGFLANVTLGATETINGTLSSAGNILVATTSLGSTLILNGNITTANGILGLGGAVVMQTGGVITAGTLDATANSISLPQPNRIRSIQQLEAETGSILIAEAPGQALSVTSGIAVSSGNTISIQADSLTLAATPPPSLAMAFTVGSPNHSTLNPQGLSAPSGMVTISAATAALPVELTGIAKTPNTLSLTNAELALIRTGTLQLGSAASNALSAYNQPTSGPLTVGADGVAVTLPNVQSLNLISGSAVNQNGALTVGSLSAAAPIVSLLAAGNRIASLGSIGSGGGSIAIADAIALTVGGLGLTTNVLTITAPGVIFGDFIGPGSRVTLNLQSGTASGTLDVGALQINGQGGSVNFTNSTIGNVSGQPAAGRATISPATNANYQLNGCTIGLATCMAVVATTTVTPPSTVAQTPGPDRAAIAVSDGIANIVASEINAVSLGAIAQSRRSDRSLPVINPMRDLSGGPLRNRQDDPDLLLPNVSEKDY